MANQQYWNPYGQQGGQLWGQQYGQSNPWGNSQNWGSYGNGGLGQGQGQGQGGGPQMGTWDQLQAMMAGNGLARPAMGSEPGAGIYPGSGKSYYGNYTSGGPGQAMTGTQLTADQFAKQNPAYAKLPGAGGGNQQQGQNGYGQGQGSQGSDDLMKNIQMLMQYLQKLLSGQYGNLDTQNQNQQYGNLDTQNQNQQYGNQGTWYRGQGGGGGQARL